MKPSLLIFALLLSNSVAARDAGPAPMPEAKKTQLQIAEELTQTRGEKNYLAALKIYEAELAKKPADLGLKLKVAAALNNVMRVKTNGNLVLINGTLDNDKNKAIWKKYGKRANEFAKEVYEKNKSEEAMLTKNSAFMFFNSSRGIVEAVFAGAADEYQQNAKILMTKHPKADNATGYIYQGSFHIVAPWPYQDFKKAYSLFLKAVSIAPKSVANQYYAGLGALRVKNWDEADKYFSNAIAMPCLTGTERDFCGFIKGQAKIGKVAVADGRK